jgi:hypothetical protein
MGRTCEHADHGISERFLPLPSGSISSQGNRPSVEGAPQGGNQ